MHIDSTARLWIVQLDPHRRRIDPRRRDEEPLALTQIGRVAAPERVLRPREANRPADQVRLQRSLRRGDAGHPERLLGNRRHEPVTLVVTAEELALDLAVADEEEQVP